MTGTYTQYPTGAATFPANATYNPLTLSANTTLNWPTENNTLGNVVALRMDVNATAGGLAITMPPANQTNVGNSVIFYGVSATTYTVLDNSGATLLSVASGQSWQLWLTDNTTTAGLWRSIQMGNGTSSASAASLASNSVIAIGSTLNQAYPVVSKGANYTFVVNDRGNLELWTGGVGTFTLLPAATATNSWFVQVRNIGTGVLTLAPQGGQLINTLASQTLNPGDSCVVICDGTGYYTVGLGRNATFAWTYVQIPVAPGPTYTLTGIQLNQAIYEFTGLLTSNIVITFPATVYEYTIINSTTGSFSMTVQPAGGTGVSIPQAGAAIIYSNGTNMGYADTLGVSVPLPITMGGTGASTAAGAIINLGIDQLSFFNALLLG